MIEAWSLPAGGSRRRALVALQEDEVADKMEQFVSKGEISADGQGVSPFDCPGVSQRRLERVDYEVGELGEVLDEVNGLRAESCHRKGI